MRLVSVNGINDFVSFLDMNYMKVTMFMQELLQKCTEFLIIVRE